jgi:parvulin-like peptidyl-prolyl isomerase
MKSRDFLVFAAGILFLLLLGFDVGVSSGAEIAKVNDEVITSEELIQDYRIASAAPQAPDATSEGKREFLDRVIAKHLLSQHFHARGWDTLSYWDTLLVEYYRGQHIQALYHEAIPESRVAGSIEVTKLLELSRQYVDSLQKAYHLVVDEKAVVFIGDRSVVRRVDPKDKDAQPRVAWSELFTEEEKEMPAATLLDAVLTIGELVESIEKMPAFARPTGGITDQIALTIEHFGREKILELEFNKRGLRDQPFFRNLVKKKREEAILNELFMGMQDSSTVTEEAVKEYYEAHRDDFVTQPVINLAVMTFGSEDVARQAARKLEEGEDFESVAVNFSIYSGSETGFDTTGFIDRGKATALFDAIWEKEIGSTAGPVAVGDEWKVVKLLARQDPRLLGLEEATPMIMDRLKFLKADEAFAGLIEELRSKAKIEIDQKALEAVAFPKLQ